MCHAIWKVVALDFDSKSDFSLCDVVDFKMIELHVLLVFGLFWVMIFLGLDLGRFGNLCWSIYSTMSGFGLWLLIMATWDFVLITSDGS